MACTSRSASSRRKARADHRPRAIDRFILWLQKLAWTYPAVTEFVIGNEPNLTRFWQPQFDPARPERVRHRVRRLLARSYDALKDVNLNIKVVGVGLFAAAGNERPRAKSNISTSPVRFIQALGIGYQRMARNKPIMDVFGFHPYPARDRDPLHRYRWPNAGVANLNRIKQAVGRIPRHGAADVPRGPARSRRRPTPTEPPSPPAEL